MIILYSLLYAAALSVIYPFEYLKRPAELRAQWSRERRGRISGIGGSDRPRIWVHAVSVGEVLAALPLIEGLQKEGYSSVVLSTVTDTGRQIAKERMPVGTHIIYLPFDLRTFIERAISAIAPDIFLTMETELWPNLFSSMSRAGIPIFIFNGRISDRSFPRYMRIRYLLKKLFSTVEMAGVQTEQDRGRMISMGMQSDKVKITGNFKFDIKGSLRAPEWTERLEGKTIVAGSTHEGEESMMLDVYERLQNKFDDINLIIAPRHPQRFSAVEQLLKERDHRFVTRASLGKENGKIKGEIILLNVLGELAGSYAAADICIICGSFVPIGGHNLFEAAYWSKPIICGPYMNNFPLTKDFEDKQAIRIADRDSLYDILTELLGSQESREVIGKNAHKVFAENGGAVKKALNILEPYLKNI
ncbi:MAG: 3-deoxy-D-manno-octulosonic acid transferase [Nitrospirota bacterium]|nr:MAG: 3-deoxy-D-manno-octulosonic acid transferase [Nitrospirota bacterium]